MKQYVRKIFSEDGIIKKIVTEEGTEHTSVFPEQDTAGLEKPSKPYQVEAIYIGGSYDGSIIKAYDLSTALEKLIFERSNSILARGLVTPIVDGVQTCFELLDGIRI